VVGWLVVGDRCFLKSPLHVERAIGARGAALTHWKTCDVCCGGVFARV
jgi:hypothetical protein